MTDQPKTVTTTVELTDEPARVRRGASCSAMGKAGDQAALETLVHAATMIGLSAMMTTSVVHASIGMLPKPGEPTH